MPSEERSGCHQYFCGEKGISVSKGSASEDTEVGGGFGLRSPFSAARFVAVLGMVTAPKQELLSHSVKWEIVPRRCDAAACMRC